MGFLFARLSVGFLLFLPTAVIPEDAFLSGLDFKALQPLGFGEPKPTIVSRRLSDEKAAREKGLKEIPPKEALAHNGLAPNPHTPIPGPRGWVI